MSTRNAHSSIATYAHHIAYLPRTAIYYLPNGIVFLPPPPSYYRPSPIVEVRGTTYFLENLHTEYAITGSFEHKGTIYFPQPFERAAASLRFVEKQREVNTYTIPGSYIRNGTTYFVPQQELMRARLRAHTPALTDASSPPSSRPSSCAASPATTNVDLPVEGVLDASAMDYLEGAVYLGKRRGMF